MEKIRAMPMYEYEVMKELIIHWHKTTNNKVEITTMMSSTGLSMIGQQ